MSIKKNFAAVSVVPGMQACPAACGLRDRRTLASEMPQLPLPNCTMPGRCRCKFAKHPDRREAGDERRVLRNGMWEVGQHNRRQRAGRRSTDD